MRKRPSRQNLTKYCVGKGPNQKGYNYAEPVLMKTNQAIGISSHNIGLFSFPITNNDSLDCNILISLLPEGKTVKIASKLGFLAPGLEKWTKVLQARILVKNGRSYAPEVAIVIR